MAALAVANKGVAQFATLLACEISGDEGASLVYMTNVKEPVEFLADLAENMAAGQPTEKRSLS